MATYRQRKRYRNIGVVCSVAFAAMGSVSVVAALMDGNGPMGGWAMAAFFAIFWGAFTFLGFWLVLGYRNYLLTITDQEVHQQGVVLQNQINFCDLREVKWRCRPVGGSVVLEEATTRMTIQFDGLERAERAEIIDSLRTRSSLDIQTGWEEFSEAFLVPSPQRQAMQRQARRLLILLAGMIGFGWIIFWWVTWQHSYLVLALVHFAAVAWTTRRSAVSNGSAECAHSGTVNDECSKLSWGIPVSRLISL